MIRSSLGLRDEFDTLSAVPLPSTGQTDARWRYSGSLVADDGLSMSAGSKIESAQYWRLSSVLCLVDVPAEPGTEFEIRAEDDMGDFHQFRFEDHKIFAEAEGLSVQVANRWDETVRWVRLVANGGVVRYDISEDGYLWETRHETPIQLDPVAVLVSVSNTGTTDGRIASLGLPANAVAQRLYDLRESWQQFDPNSDYAFLALCRALAEVLSDAAQLVSNDPELRPYETLLDPWLCPEWALGWLAALSGTEIPKGTSALRQRQLIADQASERRGRPSRIVELANPFLIPGAEPPKLRERYSPSVGSSVDSPYQFELTIHPESIRSGYTVDDIRKAVLKEKPAGLLGFVELFEGTEWDDMIGTWDDQTAIWDDL